jgi:Tfp pilus assembly ATPase PilU
MLTDGAALGMQMMDKAIVDLYMQKRISKEDAIEYCMDKDSIQKYAEVYQKICNCYIKKRVRLKSHSFFISRQSLLFRRIINSHSWLFHLLSALHHLPFLF